MRSHVGTGLGKSKRAGRGGANTRSGGAVRRGRSSRESVARASASRRRAARGSQLTNAIFADANARVIDLQPYAYKPESSAPSDYYAALLERTDVRYTPLASARPAAPPALKGAHPHANRTTASFGDDERACRDDSLCRLSYRDGGNILVGEAGRRRLRTLIGPTF